MIKIAIVACLAALAAAEAGADAWYGPYGYSNWGNNMMYGNNWPMQSGYRQMNYMNGHEGHRYQSYGKRSAEAEPEADAEAFYGNYGYNMGYNWPMMNNWYGNNWNRPGMQEGYRFHYGKRSADAEADADSYYGNYGYSNGYNWGNNMMHGNNMYRNNMYNSSMMYNNNNMMYNNMYRNNMYRNNMMYRNNYM